MTMQFICYPVGEDFVLVGFKEDEWKDEML